MGEAKSKDRLDESQVVGVSLLVSLSDVVLNFAVALITGSVVIISQALQGLSDVATAGILYLGVNRSQRDGDPEHPLGYGREIFFWSLIAALIMFMGTGGLSLYFGWQRFRNPTALDYGWLALATLGIGLMSNFYAFSQSVKRLSQNGGKTSWWQRMLYSGMVETKTTFTVDLMGTLAALFGLVAITAYLITGDGRLDGLGAMAVGVGTMVAAILIVIDVHGLIVGRAVSPEITKRIARVATKTEGVEQVLDLYTTYIGSDRLLIIVEVQLMEGLSTRHIEQVIDTIKDRIQHAVPSAHRIQVEVETPDEL